MSIQRWYWNATLGVLFNSEVGQYVKYADHVAAVAEAEIRGLMKGEVTGPMTRAFYEQGLRDENAAQAKSLPLLITQAMEEGAKDERLRIRKAVEGLKVIHVTWADPGDKWAHIRAVTSVDGVLAVIDGEETP